MEISFKTAEQALEDVRNRPKLSTGNGDLDSLIGGIEAGVFYLLYGEDKEILDLLIHKIVVNCVLPPDKGGFNAKALYFNLCNYYEDKTVLNPSRLAAIAKGAGINPTLVFQNNYSIFAFNEKQQASAIEEIVKTIENNREIRLLVVHSLTRFVETSKKPEEAKQILKEAVGVLKTTASKNDVALVVSCSAAPSRRRIPTPLGGTFLRHEANVMLYLKKGERGVSPVWAYLLKHPYRKTPQKITLYVSRGGINLMGRVTPTFRQLYHAQIKELRKHFQNTLLDSGHREAFNQLLKEAWTPEDHALSNAKVPYVLDVLNLMGNVHLMKEVAVLRQKIKELETRLNAKDGGGGTREAEDEQ